MKSTTAAIVFLSVLTIQFGMSQAVDAQNPDSAGDATDSLAPIYVGGLDFRATETEVLDLFGEFGDVVDVDMIRDSATGRGRGLAFVTMRNPEHARAAVEALNGREFQGRTLSVQWKGADASEDQRSQKPKDFGSGRW